jgi:hypothetical protein
MQSLCINLGKEPPMIKPELMEMLRQPTISVPQAGINFLGLTHNGSYEAAKRGEIPTIRIGKLLRVPTPALARLLGIEVA